MDARPDILIQHTIVRCVQKCRLSPTPAVVLSDALDYLRKAGWSEEDLQRIGREFRERLEKVS